MGNTFSSNSRIEKKTELDISKKDQYYNTIDLIASHYILTMNNKSLRKMYEKEYCDKMTILTSDIINQYFHHVDIHKMMERIQKGKSGKSEKSGKSGKKEDVVFFDPATIPEMNSQKKREICIQLAKFYIKIAHVFSAIVMTINPEYIYKDTFGKEIKKNIYEKDEWRDSEAKLVKMNLCSMRVEALKQQIHAKKDDKKDREHENEIPVLGTGSVLEDEIGIPELEDLYYDIFNYKTGNYDQMSKKARDKYHADLKKFYTHFTGKKEMPASIKKFADIHLYDVEERMALLLDNKKTTSHSKEKNLFQLYATHLKHMTHSIHDKQQMLLNILNRLFLIDKTSHDESDNEMREVTIHPDLTEDSLQKIVEETRNIIIELYLKCEDDYVEGMKIYEAIVEAQILESSQNQIESLGKMMEQLTTL